MLIFGLSTSLFIEKPWKYGETGNYVYFFVIKF